MNFARKTSLVVAFLGCLQVSAATWPAVQELQPTTEQMKQFLLTAKVVGSRPVSKGTTGVMRLSLKDENITHEAAFQAIDEAKSIFTGQDGSTQLNFRDSYKYDVAGYELATMLGLGDMVPVTVVRKWAGKTGALSWWLLFSMDEQQRLQQRIEPPDSESWNRQIYRMRVFSELVYDTGRNLGNVLISKDWHLWMIDFTRAFRLQHELRAPQNLVRCDRQLLANLRKLDADGLKARTKGLLTSGEVEGVMARRDLIVKLFENLAAQKGEGTILY